MSYQLPARFSKGANRAGRAYFFFMHLWIIIILTTHTPNTKSIRDKLNRRGDILLLFGWIGVGTEFGMMGAYIQLYERVRAGPALGPTRTHPPPHPIRIS